VAKAIDEVVVLDAVVVEGHTPCDMLHVRMRAMDAAVDDGATI
jgi:hypothetical protein